MNHSVDTPTRAAALRALAERVEAGCDLAPAISEASRLVRLDAVAGARVYDFWRVRAYLDAIAALQEAVLPGRDIDIGFSRGRWRVVLYAANACQSVAPTEPAARLAALLRALAMEAERAQ